MSVEAYGAHVKALHDKLGDKLTWQVMLDDLKQNWGFGAGVTLSEKQQQRLQQAFEGMVSGQAEGKQTLYAKVDVLADTTRSTHETMYNSSNNFVEAVFDTFNDIAGIGFTTERHTGDFVPVFAIGAGAESFQGQIDNTEIPLKIAAAAQWSK